MAAAPCTWVLLGDKGGDNGQVETIVAALPWPVTYKHLQMKPQWVQGKPKYCATVDHLDLAASDPLEGPWPDLVITIGRRPSMAALWVKAQSGGRTKIVLVGKPSGPMGDFALVIAGAENQMPPLDNFLPTVLPFMRVEAAQVAEEAAAWSARLAHLNRPLVAIFVGGQTDPFVMNATVARGLVATAQWVVDVLGGTPYVVTSRRTTPDVLSVLRTELPAQAVYFEWSADSPDNPYRALLGTADGFVVTGDSISMMVEVVYLHKPLAIFPLPTSVIGGIDQWRRSIAHWLCNPKRDSTRDRWRHGLARLVYRLDPLNAFSATRDFRAFHHMLIERKFAVWAGEPFATATGELPDDLGAAVARIEALF